MGLEILKLKKQLEIRHETLEMLETKKDDFNLRQSEIEKGLEEAKTDEDLKVLDEEIKIVSEEIKENESAIQNVNTEIEDINNKVDEINNRSENINKNITKTINRFNRSENSIENGEKNVNRSYYDQGVEAMNYREKRLQIIERNIQEPEVRQFFEKLAHGIKNRAILNTDLIFPDQVIYMIENDLLNIGNIVKLVQTRRATSGLRIIINGEIPEAIWTECCDPIEELGDLDFGLIELDCYKLGAFVSICNATIEDIKDPVNLASYIINAIAIAMSKALDRAILQGTGVKQPTGILTNMPAGNKITAAADYKKLMPKLALLPEDIGDVTAVMTRNTYYEYFLPQQILPTSAGTVVAPNYKNATLPDGTPIVFVRQEILPVGQMVIGDFSKYLLLIRKEVEMRQSREYKFIEDQTVFMGTARYDGRAIKDGYWLHITLTAPTTFASPTALSIEPKNDK